MLSEVVLTNMYLGLLYGSSYVAEVHVPSQFCFLAVSVLIPSQPMCTMYLYISLAPTYYEGKVWSAHCTS